VSVIVESGMGPSIFDVHTKIGFLTPSPVYMRPQHEPDPPLWTSICRPKKLPLFSEIFRILGIWPGNFSIFTCQNFWWPFLSLHKKNSIFTRKSRKFLILCVDVHLRLTPVHMRPHW